eukprot:g5288.t1
MSEKADHEAEERRKEKQRAAQKAARERKIAGLPPLKKKKRKKNKKNKKSKRDGEEGSEQGRRKRRRPGRQHLEKGWRRPDDAGTSLPRPKHDVVIVPIFWRNKEGQEVAVCKEAQRIKTILYRDGKLDVWIDRTHKRKPGEKFRFWEEQGVMFRVEIGPRDAMKRRCTISHQSGEAGDYSTVKKIAGVSTVRRSELLGKLRGSLGLLKIPEDASAKAKADAHGDSMERKWSEENLSHMKRIESNFLSLS